MPCPITTNNITSFNLYNTCIDPSGCYHAAITAQGSAQLSFRGLFESTQQYYWETKRPRPSVFLTLSLDHPFPQTTLSVEQWEDMSLAVSLRWLNIQWDVRDIILAQWSRMIKKKRPRNPLDDFPVMQWESPYSFWTCKDVFFYCWEDMIHHNLIKCFCLY